MPASVTSLRCSETGRSGTASKDSVSRSLTKALLIILVHRLRNQLEMGPIILAFGSLDSAQRIGPAAPDPGSNGRRKVLSVQGSRRREHAPREKAFIRATFAGKQRWPRISQISVASAPRHRRKGMNVSEFVWQRLSEWGLRRVYGYPGDGVGGLDVALEKAKDRMEYVQVRHDERAAVVAPAHAKFTREVGLCYATSGPGAIHLLNGLYDAKMEHVPVVALVG